MKLIGKILLSALALTIATMLAGVIASALPLSPPIPLPGESPSLPSMLFGSLVLVVGLVPIASSLGGRFVTRWLALGLMLYVATGVNTVVELVIFGTQGGHWYLLAFYFLCFVATAAALAWQYDSQQSAPQLPRLGTGQWVWRLAVAWLSFPVIYFLFGLCVAPFVIPIYQAGVVGLRIPLDVIMRTQLLRSFLFLASSLPVILLWTRSRRRLSSLLDGLTRPWLVSTACPRPPYMPPVLRVLHSLEIAGDSFVYALILVWLFFPRERIGTASTVLGTTVSTTPSVA